MSYSFFSSASASTPALAAAPVLFRALTPLEYFATLVEDGKGDFLFEALLSLGQDEYPDLDIPRVLENLDEVHRAVQQHAKRNGGTLVQKIKAIHHVLYQDFFFHGIVYEDVRCVDNYYLHQLLSMREGNGLMLGVLWLELAQNLNVDVAGLFFSGHFMLKVQLPSGFAVIDPLHGRVLSSEALQTHLRAWAPQGVQVNALNAEEWLACVEEATPGQILLQALDNLKTHHLRHRNTHLLVAVLSRILVVSPEDFHLYQERGLLQAQLGQAQLAVEDLQNYLAKMPRAHDRAAVEKLMAQLRV